MITSFSKTIEIASKNRLQGKKIGLITGCFDILHLGHIRLFQAAKKKADVLFVGVENDETIKISKGEGRPINPLLYRLDQLSELKSVDYVFPIMDIYNFGTEEADTVHEDLWRKIKPDFLFTVSAKDKYAKQKKERSKRLGIQFVELKVDVDVSSSEIIRRVMGE